MYLEIRFPYVRFLPFALFKYITAAEARLLAKAFIILGEITTRIISLGQRPQLYVSAYRVRLFPMRIS